VAPAARSPEPAPEPEPVPEPVLATAPPGPPDGFRRTAMAELAGIASKDDFAYRRR
jgi:hypothetical protein